METGVTGELLDLAALIVAVAPRSGQGNATVPLPSMEVLNALDPKKNQKIVILDPAQRVNIHYKTLWMKNLLMSTPDTRNQSGILSLKRFLPFRASHCSPGYWQIWKGCQQCCAYGGCQCIWGERLIQVLHRPNTIHQAPYWAKGWASGLYYQ